jgi:hypothetical protein
MVAMRVVEGDRIAQVDKSLWYVPNYKVAMPQDGMEPRVTGGGWRSRSLEFVQRGCQSAGIQQPEQALEIEVSDDYLDAVRSEVRG